VWETLLFVSHFSFREMRAGIKTPLILIQHQLFQPRETPGAINEPLPKTILVNNWFVANWVPTTRPFFACGWVQDNRQGAKRPRQPIIVVPTSGTHAERHSLHLHQLRVGSIISDIHVQLGECNRRTGTRQNKLLVL
jgi:hypothetical protein